MANSKISALTSATTPLAGTEVLPIVQSSATVKVATNDLTVRNVRAAATTGILQVSGPTAATTRTMTVPDANFTAARTDAAQSLTGDQTFATGNLVQGTAAKGVNFTANTPAAGMTSQLLKDYQEGVWTPTLAFGGASVGITYTASYNTASVTKIGSRVFVSGITSLTSKGTSTGNATLTSLPFPADGVKAFSAVACSLTGVTFTGQYAMELDANADVVYFYQVSALGVQSALTNTNFSNTSAILFNFSYYTAS